METAILAANKMQQFRFIDPFNQLYIFRAIITPNLRITLTVFTAFCMIHTDVAADR
jgi:hypothetical protein